LNFKIVDTFKKLEEKYFKKNKSFLKYFSSNILSVPVSLVTGFINFRNIDPVFMGMWATVTIFEVYSTFLRLGVVNGMNRELPFALGQGDKEKADKYAATTQMFSIFNGLILLLIAPIIIKSIHLDESYFACVTVVLIKACLSFYTTYLQGTFRSDDQFGKLANITMWGLGAKLLFCPLVFLGFNGFLTYELILIVLNSFLLHRFRPIHIKPKLFLPEMKRLILTGFPLFATSYILGVIDTFPRLFIIKDGSEQLLGLYAPILMLVNTMMIFPSSIMNFLYPKFSYQIGQKIPAIQIWKKYFKVLGLSFIGIFLVVVPGYFLMDYFGMVFPKYASSVPYLKAALLICPFLVYKMGNTINGVLRKPQYMAYYTFFYGGFQLLSYYFLLSSLDDVLLKVIYSQVITGFATLIFSMVMNYTLVLKFDKQNSLQVSI
jgi:O-antigen/teichoic acid export membrane protein